jgi:cleavage and polyadenylation specificity factor subunit 1
MTLFGKDMDELEVVAADFLPDGEKLYMIVADADCNLNVLQYDPEGTKHRTSPLSMIVRPLILDST